MILRYHISQSTKPAPQYTTFIFDGIRFFKSFYPKGAWQTYFYPESVPYYTTRICQIQVTGHMSEPTSIWPDRFAGWISRGDSFQIPAGTWSRSAEENTELWCCHGQFDDQDLSYVTPMHFNVGDSVLLGINDNLFIINGTLTTKHSQHDVRTGIRLKIKEAPIELVAATEGYAFRWNSTDALKG